MACISYWVMSESLLVAFWSGMSSVSGSRLMTTPAAWVDALRATPSRCRAKSMIRFTAGSASTISRSGRGDLDGLVQLDPELVRDRLGDAVHLAVGVAQDAADVADGGPGQHRAERDDLGDVVLAVLAPDVGDDLFASAVLEVHVDVRHRHAVRVEEPLERELVQDRVDRRDAQRVGHDRARRAASAGRLDPLLAGEPDEVRDDEEVARVAHRDDDAELVVEPLLELRRDRPVAALEAALALLAEPASRRCARPGPGSAGCAACRAAAGGRSSRRSGASCGSRRAGPGTAPPSGPPTSRRTRASRTSGGSACPGCCRCPTHSRTSCASDWSSRT